MSHIKQSLYQRHRASTIITFHQSAMHHFFRQTVVSRYNVSSVEAVGKVPGPFLQALTQKRLQGHDVCGTDKSGSLRGAKGTPWAACISNLEKVAVTANIVCPQTPPVICRFSVTSYDRQQTGWPDITSGPSYRLLPSNSHLCATANAV